jgi:hypothetical protein
MLSEFITLHGCAFRALSKTDLATHVVGTLFCSGTNILVRNMSVLESIKIVINVFNHRGVALILIECAITVLNCVGLSQNVIKFFL